MAVSLPTQGRSLPWWRGARLCAGLLIAGAGLGLWGQAAPAAPRFLQDAAPVTILDSPVAWQLFQQAVDQARDNPAEAARLAQRLLDGYADRLIPGGDDPDRFEGVVERVERFLREQPATLDRYRSSESPEAARAFAAGDLHVVALRRGLTPAGLRAHLQLAERDFRAARFGQVEARLARIEGHPDLLLGAGEAGEAEAEAAVSYWFLRAASAGFAGDRSARETAVERLKGLSTAGASGVTDAIVALDGLLAIEPLPIPDARDPLSLGEPAGDEATGWQQVWSRSLEETPFARSFVGAEDIPGLGFRRSLDRARFDGTLLVTAPTVVGDRVLVVDGDMVRCLDRLSHRELWATDIGAGAIDRDPGPLADIASVAVGEGRVVVLPGQGSVTGRGTPGRVSCLDLLTGEERWDTLFVTAGGEEFEDLFPIGQPVIADGLVITLARKLTTRLETVEYALAFDLDTGRLRWGTHLVSCGGVNIQGTRGGARPVIEDGAVWIATSVGAVARLDLADGRPTWLRRFLVPVRDARYGTEPWEIGSAALVGDSLFAVTPDQSTVVQLERATGRLRASFPTGLSTAWHTPRYLLADQGDGIRPARVFAVGGDLRAFDPDRPAEPLWSFAEVNAGAFGEREGISNRVGIRGRVQLAGDVLVVPGLNDVLLVSRETGRVLERIEAEGPMNPVLAGPQLLLGQNSGLSALMPAASAERLMRDRILRSPADPEGGLALLDLALRTRRLGLCLEAAQATRAAMGRAEDQVTIAAAREELTGRLLQAVAMPGADSDEVRALHGMLAEVAETPSQRVRQSLSLSDWLVRQGRFAEGIVPLDRILGDPVLAGEVVRRDRDTLVPARSEARRRLLTLTAAAEAQAALGDRDAALRARLATVPRGDVVALTALADAAMGSPVAAEAAVAAGGSGQVGLAVFGSLLRALRFGPAGPSGDAMVEGIASAALSIARERGWSGLASDFADVLAATRPSLRVDAGGGGSAAPIASLVTRPSSPAAVGDEPGPASNLPGTLVRIGPLAERFSRMPGALFVVENNLELRRPAEPPGGNGEGPLTTLWKAPIEDRNPLVVAFGGAAPAEAEAIRGRLLLWQEPSDRTAFAALIDLADGTTVARTPAVGDLLSAAALLNAGRPVDQIMPDETPYVPGQVLPIVAGRHLLLVRRNGDAVGFSLDDLSTPLWTSQRLLDQVYDVSATDWGVAIAGRSPPVGVDSARSDPRDVARGQSRTGAPAVLCLDPATGTLISRATLDQDSSDEEIRWMDLSPTGELVVGTSRAVVALDALPAQGDVADLLWRSTVPGAQETRRGWRFGETMVFLDQADTLTAVDVVDGTLRGERFRAPIRLDGRSASVRDVVRLGDRVVVRFDDRIVLFGLDGAVLGEDAIADQREFLLILPTADSLLAFSSLGSRQVPAGEGMGMRFEYGYLVYPLGLADGLRLRGPAIHVRTLSHRAERAVIVDGFLLVSTAGGALAVPLPVGSGPVPAASP